MAHVLVVSFTSQGHINPCLRLAKRLAAKGLLVTFVSFDDVAHKIRAATKDPSAANGDPIPVGRGYLRFDFFSDGWELVDPRRYDLEQYMPQLEQAGSPALADLVRRHAEHGRPVRFVVGNPFVPWVLDVADSLGIPSGVLWVQSCAVFSAYYHYYHRLAEFPSVERPDVAAVELPGMAPLKRHEIPSFLLPENPFKSLTVAILAQFRNLEKGRLVLVNTFEDLEKGTIDAVSPLAKLVPVGPLVDLHEEHGVALKTDLFEAADECVAWLDKQEQDSVVYVSVGSVVRMTEGEVQEMAWGLRRSGKRFLWVVREDTRALLPEGFVEETKEHGIVVSWSPQDRVLSHSAVACFLTHCGWNSTLESLTYGKPVIAYPHWGDQPTDAKFLVEVFGVGLHLRPPTESGTSKQLEAFTREDLERAVAEAVDGSMAVEIRKKAAMWKEVARRAVAEGGSSDQSIQSLVDEIPYIDAGVEPQEETAAAACDGIKKECEQPILSVN